MWEGLGGRLEEKPLAVGERRVGLALFRVVQATGLPPSQVSPEPLTAVSDQYTYGDV